MSKTSNNSGIGFMSLLGLAFIILKLCHVIEWSWWWVTAPFWGVVPFVLILVLIGFIRQINR